MEGCLWWGEGEGVGGTRAGRVQASRSLCFAHELAPYCIQHPIHHEIYISLRVTLPKTQPKKTQFSKNEKSTRALSQSGREIYWLGLNLTRYKDALSNFQILPDKKNLSPVFALAGWGRLLLFSSGECALDWFRIQRLVKGCPAATKQLLHYNLQLVRIISLHAALTQTWSSQLLTHGRERTTRAI